jgi:hypothetical protein
MLALLNQFVSKIRTPTTRVYEFSAPAMSNLIQAELLGLANLAWAITSASRRHDPFRDCQPHRHAPRGGHALIDWRGSVSSTAKASP